MVKKIAYLEYLRVTVEQCIRKLEELQRRASMVHDVLDYSELKRLSEAIGQLHSFKRSIEKYLELYDRLEQEVNIEE